jgi:nucleotide-binding universal stress UspA family protein
MSEMSARPVVVGIDGSEDSRRAALLAAEEARRRRSPLRLLHVLPSPFRGILTVPSEPDLSAVLHDNASDVIQAVETEVSALVGAERVSWSIVEGRPVEVLREATAEAQLLVLGSRGAGGVAGLLLGSTASGVVAGASCPVVVLPDDTLVSVSERRSVVVGVHGRRGDDEVLAFAYEEAAALGIDLVAVHAWQDTQLDPADLTVSPLIDWAAVQADEERVLAETLAGWREKQPDVVIREVVIRDKPARALLATALTAQLLVVGHRRRNRLGTLTSTTHGVLHRAACPVAVVPVGSGQED